MAWSPDEIRKFEEIVAKLAAESHLAKPGSDEGLIPIYSLINEITWSLPQTKELAEAVEAILEMLQPMLDDANPFDDASIEAMRTFAHWCSDCLESLKNGAPIESYLATSDAVASNFTPAPADYQPSAYEAPQYDIAELLQEQPAPIVDFDFDAPLTPAIPAAPATTDPYELAANQAEIVGNDRWPAEQITIFAKIAQQFSAELLLAEKGSDEGMLPVYSLLKDFESDFDSHDIIHEAIVPVLAKMDALLDAASAYDSYALQLLTDFNIWLESALTEIKAGRDPIHFAPAPDNAAALKPSQTAAAPVLDESDALLKEFKVHDVVMDLNMGENEELLQEFHTEALDHLGQIETAVLELEQDVGSRDAINSMFRSFHTIKGVAGFLNLIPVNRLAHEVESLMDLVRNDKLPVFTGLIDLVLEAKDTITKLIDQITQALANGTLPSQVIPVSHLMARARWAQEGPDSYAQRLGNKPAAAPKKAAAAAPTSAAPAKSASTTAEAAPKPAAKSFDAEEDDEAPVSIDGSADPKTAAAAKRKAAENATIRVNTFKLDNLMDMVGELVIVQSQLLESSRQETAGSANDNSVLQRNMSQLSRITKELQHTSMSLRMIPIKQTFQKMGRIVRDLGAKCGKKVKFEVYGEDTELDRNVVEEIGDPLVHMVRNALDHGLEATEDRAAAGKEDTGNITLKAYHQGSSIVIELADDGRGINPEKVLKKAIANGIVQEGDQLTKEEIYKLIFAAGFSTAEKITDISGRGVGMDVVKKNIERLRGKVEIDSELGKGSTFKILLPLTMAIVDGLVVKVGQDRFILPTTSVKVALRPDDSVLAKIQGNQEILNIRGKIIPLFRLHQHFGIPGAITNPREATVVVVETDGRPFGLLVDDMISKQEVVIKSLGSMMQGIPGVSGGAILGDGTIALILDPASLISAA